MRTKFYSENLNGRDCLGDLYVGGKKIFKWLSNKYDFMMWTGFI
jgi:hypothetical protein